MVIQCSATGEGTELKRLLELQIGIDPLSSVRCAMWFSFNVVYESWNDVVRSIRGNMVWIGD